MIKLASFTLFGAFAALALAAHAAPPTIIRIAEQPGHVTEGTVTVDASPAAVYALVTDYARWRGVLTDVTAVRVVAGGRHDGTVRFRSRALEHEVTVRFANVPDRSLSFRGIEGPPGGRARGSYALVAVDGGTRTQITARLYLDVVGVPGVFVTDRKLRKLRRAKLAADLADVARYFATARAAPGA